MNPLRLGKRSAGGGPTRNYGLRTILILFVFSGSMAFAQSQNEYMLRAAYVFNLAKYVEWPQQSGELTVGFVGEGPMGETLQKMLAGKTLGSRPIRVWLSPPDGGLEHCDVVYVAQSSSKERHALLERLKSRSILTIGETDSFAREDGIVSLIRVGDQMRIEINMEAARAAQLKFSSRLLNLSSVVVLHGKN